MNTLMNPIVGDMHLAERVRTAFQRQVGKQAELRVCPDTDTPPCQTLVFRPKGGKLDRTYLAEPVAVMDAPVVAKIIRDWQPDANKLVMAPYVADQQARKLKDAGIPFLDTAGNAYLAWPGFFLFITGCTPAADFDLPRPARTTRMFNPTGLQVLFVLLARPDYLNRPYRDIAEAAGVALGTVGWVMTDLKAQGYLLALDKETKRLKKRDQLIEEWAMAYIRQLYPRRTVLRFRAENPDWWKTAGVQEFDALWGGDVAGDRLTGYLKPAEFTIYAKGIPGKLLQAQRMRADPNGDVAIIETFWNFPPNDAEKDIVPPLLVYADLMATGDPRAIEIAKLIYERHLAQPDREA